MPDAPKKDAPKKMEYKGQPASIIMIGNKQKAEGWKGELYVAVIQYGPKTELKYDVVPDSTDPADLDDLPEVKSFPSRDAAIAHFMKLERNKDKWKT